MSILSIEHVSKLFGDRMVLDDVSCGIEKGEKIGIVGVNGTGKSTFLKIAAGLSEPDDGQVICQSNLRVASLPQNPVFPEGSSVLSCVTDGEAGIGWDLEAEGKRILNRLGFTDYEEPVDHLSGGQKKRVALARTLVQPVDVLALDEPTNHLDNEMVAWLEDYLIQYRGVVIMVTHDRYFLDRVSNRILEIDHGKLYSYQANYSGFLEGKARRQEMELATERKRQSVMRMELEWAKRGCRARSTKQRARLERLETLKNGAAPVQEQTVKMGSMGTRMGRKTVEFSHITKSFGGRTLISDFSYIVLKNQRLGIIGPNGCGKSTLLHILMGSVAPDQGTVEIGDTIRMGYFAQEVGDMDGSRRVIDDIRDVAEYIQTKEGQISASQMLERFLFSPDMQYTPVSRLSGGEKRRLYLLKVLMGSPNVLVLDEPTNDLDIPTLTILEDYLDAFSGIVIAVSHDRYFLDNVVDRIFAFGENGVLEQYEGGYTDYLEAYRLRHPEEGKQPLPEKKKEKAPQTRPHQRKLRFSYKEEREYETIDGDIAALEEKLEDLERQVGLASSDFVRLNQLMAEQEQTKAALEEKMERWVYLTELAEQIEAQKG
ncbi:MAG: ABC-F family ATP-binding cassette domain-containing protein [Lachnospiraceae bacterium]|nr:ABC-F family ATP-binding cassette domain-containing protein [Lachnospiraceae bacterium]